MLGKAEGSDKGNGDTPIDFNDCVSKNELRAILDDKFNETLQQITNLARGLKMLNNDILDHVLMKKMMISLRRMMATWRLKPKLNDVLRMHVTVIG